MSPYKVDRLKLKSEGPRTFFEVDVSWFCLALAQAPSPCSRHIYIYIADEGRARVMHIWPQPMLMNPGSDVWPQDLRATSVLKARN